MTPQPGDVVVPVGGASPGGVVPAGDVVVPAEWAPHERTWMCFPTEGYSGGDLETSASAWSEVANTVVEHEPVDIVVDPAVAAVAARWLSGAVTMHPMAIDDCWMRDTGPTFRIGAGGAVEAVAWTFNGWGQQEWARWERDAHVGAAVAGWAGVEVESSAMVNEGGAMAHDGEGTVVVTETVQLDPGRNPDATRASVEAELAARLGARRVIWMPRGLAADYRRYGTRGHVDLLVAWTAPGECLVHLQEDPGHPDHALSVEATRILGDAGIGVTPVPAPGPGPGGGIHDWSYINFYVANGVVVVPTYDDRRSDDIAVATLRDAFPGRAVRAVDGRPLFALGGGVHCITLQQPAAPAGPDAHPHLEV